MRSIVYAPFVLSVLAVALTRTGVNRLTPRVGAWAISVAAVTLALSGVGALLVLACPLPAQLPFIASLGRWQPHSVAASSPTPRWLSLVALVGVALLVGRAVRELRRLGLELAQLAGAQAELAGCGTGEVVIVDSAAPHAHAVSRTLTRRGRVVVTSGLFAVLDDEERAAVVAHERAHLRHGHSAFLAAVRLAATLNPLLRPLRPDLHYVLERWADEDAAAVTHPSVIASALAKAALAIRQTATPPALPVALPLHTHAVARRVAALLDDPRERSRRAWVLLALAAIAAASLGWAMHDTERFFEAVRLWHRH
jgi:Zn-dependent protease with chaperone function